MSRLVISPNLFLESQELKQIIRFLGDDGYKRALQSIVKTYGIALPTTNSDSFRVSVSGSAAVQVAPGVAFDKYLNAIHNEAAVNFDVPNTGIDYWLKIRYGTSKLESGTVSVTTDGALSGNGTEFTKVLRGQPNYPTKVKFVSSVNTGEYEVVRVASDTEAIIVGALTPEAGVRYSVVGCFTPGFSAAPANKEIYEYDSVIIELVNSVTAPILVRDEEFLLARIYYSSVGDLTVEDMRQNYVFNSDSGLSGAKPQNALLTSLMSWRNPANMPGWWALTLDHGYKIDEYMVQNSPTADTITIVSGSCNFLGSATPPTNFFKGWRLFNRTNSRSCLIDENRGRDLISYDFSTSMLGERADLVLIPNWYEIEFEVTQNTNQSNAAARTTYFRRSVENITDIIMVPQLDRTQTSNNLRVMYRLIQGNVATPWRPLAIAPYRDSQGSQLIMPSISTFFVTLSATGGGGGDNPVDPPIPPPDDPTELYLSPPSLTFDQAGGTQYIRVTASDDTWQIDDYSLPANVSAVKTSNTEIMVTCGPNSGAGTRNMQFSVTQMSSGQTVLATITQTPAQGVEGAIRITGVVKDRATDTGMAGAVVYILAQRRAESQAYFTYHEIIATVNTDSAGNYLYDWVITEEDFNAQGGAGYPPTRALTAVAAKSGYAASFNLDVLLAQYSDSVNNGISFPNIILTSADTAPILISTPVMPIMDVSAAGGNYNYNMVNRTGVSVSASVYAPNSYWTWVSTSPMGGVTSFRIAAATENREIYILVELVPNGQGTTAEIRQRSCTCLLVRQPAAS